MEDVTITALHRALSGLSARRRAIAANVANLETPGYTAQRVDFEASLSAALEAGRRQRSAAPLLGVAPTTSASTDPAGANGNNVNLDDETVAMVETDLRYQASLEAMNAKFRLLRTAINEGR